MDNWYPVPKDQRPEGFVAARKAICTSPCSCFDRFLTTPELAMTEAEADAWPVCGPCDFLACEALKAATALVAKWEHGDEVHRQWLRDIAIPDVAVALLRWKP